MCFHTVVSGFGMMGDALICTKCGKEKYPEVFGFYWKRLPATEENVKKAFAARRRKEERLGRIKKNHIDE